MSASATGRPAWLCYEDMGYKHIPACWPGGCPSCSGAGCGRRPSQWPSTPTIDRKRAALDCYRSQLLALEADWQARPEARRARAGVAARAPAARVGGTHRRVTAGVTGRRDSAGDPA